MGLICRGPEIKDTPSSSRAAETGSAQASSSSSPSAAAAGAGRSGPALGFFVRPEQRVSYAASMLRLSRRLLGPSGGIGAGGTSRRGDAEVHAGRGQVPMQT